MKTHARNLIRFRKLIWYWLILGDFVCVQSCTIPEVSRDWHITKTFHWREPVFNVVKKKLNKKSKENKSVPKVKVKKVKSESFRKSKNVNLHRSDFVWLFFSRLFLILFDLCLTCSSGWLFLTVFLTLLVQLFWILVFCSTLVRLFRAVVYILFRLVFYVFYLCFSFVLTFHFFGFDFSIVLIFNQGFWLYHMKDFCLNPGPRKSIL